MPDIVAELRAEGFVIVRGFFNADDMQRIGAEVDRIYQEGLKHHATYRDRNLLLEVLDDPRAGRRVVIQAHWTPWISPYLELMRRDPRYLELLEPILGRDIRQITHQIHWKPPGAKQSTPSTAIIRTRAFATPRACAIFSTAHSTPGWPSTVRPPPTARCESFRAAISTAISGSRRTARS